MSAEALVQPVLAATTVSEQSRDLVQNMREFYDRNHVAISIAAVFAVSVFINRALVRRELTRLRFAVELIPEGDLLNPREYDFDSGSGLFDMLYSL